MNWKAAGGSLLLAATVCLHASDGCGFSGRVINRVTGAPVNRARVVAKGIESSTPPYSGATDDGGNFCIPGNTPGDIELAVQKRGFVESAMAFHVSAAQAADAIIRLNPQGVITGQVLDADGEPVASVSVHAIQSRYTGGLRRYVVSTAVSTNDLGEYRIFGLKPGTYYLGASYRGEAGNAGIYFPGVQEASRALSINVAAGAELHGLNLALTGLSTLRIRGTVRSAIGLEGIKVVALPCDAGPLNRAVASVRNSDGAFELVGVAAGCYILAADTLRAGKRYSARATVSVTNSDVDDVHLNIAPPLRVPGRINVEGNPQGKLSQVVVTLESPMLKLSASAAAGEDGSVELDNVVPETYQLSALLPEGYYLKSARFGETDALKSGIDLSRGGNNKLDITIASDGGQIDGVAADDNDRPAAEAVIVLAPENARERWLFKIADADGKGAFSLRGVAPGEYKIYAGEGVELGSLQDPEYLKQFDRDAQRISIPQKGRASVRLRAISR